MTTVQRRRGREVTFWAVISTTDSRGNIVEAPDPTSKTTVRAAIIPQRSQRAEVAGQVSIDVTRVLVPADIPGVSLWSRAELDGEEWDLVTPPALHWGQRNTRHWTIDLKRRPS